MSVELKLPVSLPLPAAELKFGPAAKGEGDAAKIREVAHEFESMLLLQMLRQMRQSASLLGDEEGELGYGADVMRDTIDVELARALSLAGGIGIADIIARSIGERAGARAETPASGTGHDVRAADPRPAATSGLMASGPLVAAPTAGSRGVGEATMPVSGPPDVRPAVRLPLDSAVTSGYGWRADPLHGRRRFHGGVDVRAAYGTEVPSAGAGRVVSARDQGGYGLMVVVEHAPGLQTRYAHLSASLVRAGDLVADGQPIGRVGASGRATGSHLHFEVVQDGRRIDPRLAADRFAALGPFKSPATDADSPSGGEPVSASEE